MGVNVSKSWEALNHFGCSVRGFTVFADHFIIFNSNPILFISFFFSHLNKYTDFSPPDKYTDWPFGIFFIEI